MISNIVDQSLRLLYSTLYYHENQYHCFSHYLVIDCCKCSVDKTIANSIGLDFLSSFDEE